MNIGMEAKRAFVNGTGLGQYARTLITTLAANYPEHAYYLCTPKSGRFFNDYAAPNVHTILPTGFLPKLFPALWRSNWVKKDLAELRIDIFHGLSHELPNGIHKTGIRSVVTIHDLIHEKYPEQYAFLDRKIYTHKFKYACNHADRIIAISEQTKKDIVDLYQIDPQKISVCYQGCNILFTQSVAAEIKQQVSKKYNLPDQYMLYVGSIIERKNLLNICKAIQLLKTEISIPLVVIGEGRQYQEQVKAYLKTSGIENRIIFLTEQSKQQFGKNVPFGEMPAIFQMASMMIYPSLYEGFGIPVLEALWSKIPVITSNVSCLPEVGGNAAFYVDPHSPQEIANMMTTILNNPALVQERIAMGLIHAAKFSNEKAAAAVMEIYQSLY